MYSVNTQISPYICLVWSVFAVHAHISAWSGQSSQSTPIYLPGLVSLRSPRPYICLVWSVFAVHAHISAWSGQSLQSTLIYLPGLLSLRSPRPYICLVCSVFAVHAHISAWSGQSSLSTPIYLPDLVSLRSPHSYICLVWSVFAVHMYFHLQIHFNCRDFHYHPSVIWIWLKKCSEGRKTWNHHQLPELTLTPWLSTENPAKIPIGLCVTLPGGYKAFFMLNSAEHEIFPANKYENANNSWHI